MEKTILIKKLMYVFILLIGVNVLYEIMRLYVQGSFDSKEILSKTILELGVLVITGIVFLRK